MYVWDSKTTLADRWMYEKMYKVKNKNWCPNEKRENSKNEGTRIKRDKKKGVKN